MDATPSTTAAAAREDTPASITSEASGGATGETSRFQDGHPSQGKRKLAQEIKGGGEDTSTQDIEGGGEEPRLIEGGCSSVNSLIPYASHMQVICKSYAI